MATEQPLPPSPTTLQLSQEACASYKSCTKEVTWLAPTAETWALAGEISASAQGRYPPHQENLSCRQESHHRAAAHQLLKDVALNAR